MEEDALFLGQFCQLLDGVDVAHFVVGEHDGDNGRVRSQGFFVFVQVKASLAVNTKAGHPVALALPHGHGLQDGRMLHAGGDNVALVLLGFQGRPDGAVVAFGAAGGEDDFAGLAVQHCSYLLACRLHVFGNLAAKGVHA